MDRRAVRWLPLLVFLVSPFLVYPLRFVRAGLLDGGDDAMSNLPFLVHSAAKLLKLEISWTPALWLGTPVLDEPEFATFYLPRLLILLFAPVTGFAVYVLLHYVLAQSALYLYARSVGASRAASVFGGLAYGFSGFMLGHRGHTMYVVAGAWAPLFLYFVRRAEQGKGRSAYAGAALSFAALPLSGAAQLTLYFGLLVLVLHGTMAILSRTTRPLICALSGLLPGALLGMAQILPSMAFVGELVEAPREGYALSVDLSFDPRLLSLLVIPHDPLIRAEHYSRIGAVVLAFVCAGLTRGREPVVRSWALVAGGALLLMMGRYVPVLPRVLHSIPVISVFRGPVRHNFELGLATSLLAVFGFDAALGGALSRKWSPRWILLAGASAAGLVLLGRAGLHSPSLDRDAKALATAASDPWVLTGAVLVALGFSMMALAGTRARLAAGALVLFAPIAEARLSTHWMDRVWPDYPAALERARRSFERGGVRLLPPPADVAGLDALADDTAALLPGFQSLTGYSSMANQDSAVLLDLDMMGHPRFPADLAWSRLPSVLGVTHLILPDAICDPLEASAGPDAREHACLEASSDAPPVPRAGGVQCFEQLGTGVSRFGVGVGFTKTRRAPRARLPSMRVRFSGRGKDVGHEPWVTFGGGTEERRTKPLRAKRLPPDGIVSVYPLDPRPLLLDELTIDEERLETVVGIGVEARMAPGGAGYVELGPDRPAVKMSFEWPAWVGGNAEKPGADPPRLLLELEARALATPSRAVAVDLYRAPGFDPVTAQMDVTPGEIGPGLVKRAAFIEPPPPPRDLELRVLYEGNEAVQVRSARLLGARRRHLFSVPGAFGVQGAGVTLTGGLGIDADGAAFFEYHLPVRPVTVTVVVESVRSATPLAFGLSYDRGLDAPPAERSIAPGSLSGRQRFTFTANVPAEAARIDLHARSDPKAGSRILRLEAHSACSSRSYVPVGSLGNGWKLYENRDALPRVYTVGAVRAVQSVDEARQVLREDDGFDARASALVEGAPSLPDLRAGAIEASEFEDERLALRVSAPDGPTFVVVNDRFHPRWRATVDGSPAPLYRTNGIVRGLVVPRGSHTVEMRFTASWAARAGACFALLGFAFVFIAPYIELLLRKKGAR